MGGRVLQSSCLPEFLGTDAALMVGVEEEVKFLTKLNSLMAILVAVAGVVTPLGLYDTLTQSGTVVAPFHYTKDSSLFGEATYPRSKFSFTRKCYGAGGFLLAPCPYTDTLVTVSDHNLNFPYGYDTRVPQSILDIYSSGTSGLTTTVSNHFEIQWRQYKTIGLDFFNNGSAFTEGTFRPVQSMVLNNAVQPVEGLIVDMKNGGIGFRNHTIPTGLKNGAAWTEDLLFIEPESICVNTNLTLDFTVALGADTLYAVSKLSLVDRGGFVNLNITEPQYGLGDPQKNPGLHRRAYKAAWISNVLTMFYLNVTNPAYSPYGEKRFAYINSSLGREFPIPIDSGAGLYDALRITPKWADYLPMFSFAKELVYANPFNITRDNFTNIGKP